MQDEDHDAETAHAAVEGCRDALLQCAHLAAELDAARWTSTAGGSGSIGAHLRHCLEHFECLVEGLPAGEVNYDLRRRDARMEADTGHFAARCRQVAAELERLAPMPGAHPVLVSQTVGPEAIRDCQRSTLARELSFLSSHTIHHLALARILASIGGTELPAHIGVAYSTLEHRRVTTG